MRIKRIGARFYQTEAGREAVRDWLLGLSDQDRKIVGQDIARVEFGWPIGMPVCEAVQGYPKLMVIRSTIKDGKVEARTYFAIERAEMVLLHGNEGKTDQNADIEKANDRWKSYKQRKRRS
ncbi:MAG: type II toxin-antitoxin system RelE/ParE family toxin [Alphaproteobacteria bacterium]|nr:MAG: type II toxin-antitoxin system RelE/ParE family toxin [Alphaproteobacteria bacterium]